MVAPQEKARLGEIPPKEAVHKAAGDFISRTYQSLERAMQISLQRPELLEGWHFNYIRSGQIGAVFHGIVGKSQKDIAIYANINQGQERASVRVITDEGRVVEDAGAFIIRNEDQLVQEAIIRGFMKPRGIGMQYFFGQEQIDTFLNENLPQIPQQKDTIRGTASEHAKRSHQARRD